jgi:hypothetical protein
LPQRAWESACNANWIREKLNELTTRYNELTAEERSVEGEITKLENAVDYHTVENRKKREELKQKGKDIAAGLKVMALQSKQAVQDIQLLSDKVDMQLSLAEYAKSWSWPAELPKPEDDGPEAASNK